MKAVPSEAKSRSRDVRKSNRSRARTSTARPTTAVGDGKGQTPAKEGEKADNPEPKQDLVLDPEFAGNLLQRELARLNLNVLRTMARMLGEQEQKFAAERNTLRATGRMMRAEMRRALSETVKINSERQKLDLERDVLQSQLLARRRSARLLERMMTDFDHGRELNRLYMHSRVLGSAPTHRGLGEQLDYETDVLDQQRFYLQSLMGPPEDGELYPVELTRMHPPRIPPSEIRNAREWLPDSEGLAGEWANSVSVPPGQVEPEEPYDERLVAGTEQTSL